MKPCSQVILLLAMSVGIAGHVDAQGDPESAPTAAERSATDRALEELSAAYEGLAGLLNQGSGEAVDRVAADVENIGDWEYRIVEIPDGPAALQEEQLNELGDERWEVYWVAPAGDTVRFYLKRSSISYLSRVPLSTLMRVIPGGGQ